MAFRPLDFLRERPRLKGLVVSGLAFVTEPWRLSRWCLLWLWGVLLRVLPLTTERRETLVIGTGNRLFRRPYDDSVYASFASYIERYPARLDVYCALLDAGEWIDGREVLELGSGLGQYSRELARRGARSVVGLEISSRKSRWCASNDAPPSDVRWVRASAESLPFADASFDTVFSHTVFEHLSDVSAALGEARRCLRPGGYLILSYHFFGQAFGHHLFPYVHFPWSTRLVRERTLCEHWCEALRRDHARGLAGFFSEEACASSLSEGAEWSLNKMSFLEFEALLDELGWRRVARRTSEVIGRLLPFLRRVPRLAHAFTGTVYYVLQKV